MNKTEMLALQRELAVNGACKTGASSKYKNKSCYEDGLKFDSELERGRYRELKLMLRAGEIYNLRTQVPFILEEGVEFELEGKSKGDMKYIADFVYNLTSNDQMIVEDVKSKMTAGLSTYRMKKHLMKSRHNIEIVEIKSIRAKPKSSKRR